MSRIIIVDYDNEKERKRAEYLFNDTYEENTDSFNGIVTEFNGDDEEYDEFFADLKRRVPGDNIEVKDANNVDFEGSYSDSMLYEVDLGQSEVEPFVNYWFGRDGEPVSEDGNVVRLYKKNLGWAEASYDFDGGENQTEVEVDWRAADEEALRQYSSLFDEELDSFIEANSD